MEQIDFFRVKLILENIKILSSSLVLLQKVGKEVTLDIDEDSVLLRVINESKSAYLSVQFMCTFFEEFGVSQEGKNFAGAIPIKHLYNAFKNTKKVKSGIISACRLGAEHELTFEMTLVNGITRIHRFRYSECEIMNAMFDEGVCSMIRAKPKILTQILHHIHDSNEIVLIINQSSFSIKSSPKTEDLMEGKRQMSTGIVVNLQEFDIFEYRSSKPEEEFKFVHREVSAFLQFCEATDQYDFDLFFSTAGSALKFGCKLDNYFSVSLIIATSEIPRSIQSEKIFQDNAAVNINPSDENVLNIEVTGNNLDSNSGIKQHPLSQSNSIMERLDLDDMPGSNSSNKSSINKKKRFLEEFNEE